MQGRVRSTHRLSQGRVPLSSCRTVGEDRAPLTDSQERVQPCDCRVGWKTGIYPQASAAASTGAGEQRGFVMVPTCRMQMH